MGVKPYSWEAATYVSWIYPVLFKVLRELEDLARSDPNPSALISVQEARSSLEKHVQKMDNLESGFDRIAERSRELKVFHDVMPFSILVAVLSASWLSASRRRRMLHPTLPEKDHLTPFLQSQKQTR